MPSSLAPTPPVKPPFSRKPWRCRLRHVVAAGVCTSLLSTALLLFHASELPNAPHAGVDGARSVLPRRVGSVVRRALDVLNATTTSLTCRDAADGCAVWAASGECEKNAPFMNVSCKRSCGLCPTISGGRSAYRQRGGASCEDRSSFCGQWAAVGECDSNPNYSILARTRTVVLRRLRP